MRSQTWGSVKPYAILIGAIIVLGVTTYVDYITIGITFIAVYIFLIYIVSTYVGGRFSFVFAILAGIAQVQTEPHIYDHRYFSWFLLNTICSYMFIAYMIIRKNKALGSLEKITVTDELTKLPNRRAFNDYIERSIAHARRWAEQMSIAYIDVDHFKFVNDIYGHQVGDELLRCIGSTIKENLRADDMGARLGGDEFAIILKHTSGDHNSFIQRIKEELDECVEKSLGKYIINRNIDVTFSIGMINYDGSQSVTPDEILNAADELMYEVKKTSKNAIKSKIYEKKASV